MKKLLCVALTILLLGAASLALGEDMRAVYNPEDYDLLLITDIYTNSDSEMDEKGNFAPAVEQLTVQGCFGTIDMTKGEWDAEYKGFDRENIASLVLAPDCELLLATDPIMNPVENAPVTDLQAWYDAASQEFKTIVADEPYEFYALFTMNEAGELTRLEYCYLP